MQRTVPVLGSNSRCNSELLDPDRQDGEGCGPQDGSAVASEKKPKKRSSRFQIQIQKGVMQDRYVPSPGSTEYLRGS